MRRPAGRSSLGCSSRLSESKLRLRLHRHPVAGLIERPRGRGAHGGQSQIALLFEQRCAEAHGVGAGENDDIEILESAELGPRFRADAPRRLISTAGKRSVCAPSILQ